MDWNGWRTAMKTTTTAAAAASASVMGQRRRRSRSSSICRFYSTVRLLLFVLLATNNVAVIVVQADNLALLSGTLRTIQRAACDGETLTLRCPLGTAVSIQLAQYGRPAPGLALCSSSSSSSSTSAVATQNDTCPLTPQMQHALLQTVVETCVKRRHCKFSTSVAGSVGKPPPPSSAFGHGDSETGIVPVGLPACAGQPPKFVEVAYKCRPLEFRSKIICENETIQLKCKRNARIAVYSATFGRVHFQSLQCPQPPGVEDETCEASFSTETVMQMCHGKRRCTLSASASTFGNPCSPQSHLYLRVVYTCVSRRILKDHYQGDLEEDESPDHLQIMDNDDLMNENSFESDDYAEPVSSVVTPIPPSGNYPQDDHPGYYRTTTRRPAGDLQSKRGGGFFGDADDVVLDVDDNMLGDLGEDELRRRQQQSDQARPGDSSGRFTSPPRRRGNSSSTQEQPNGQNVFNLITEWISSVSFMKENQEKFILYLTLSIAAGILVLLTLLIGRLWWQKKRRNRETGKSIHSSDPIPAFADDVSDVDNDIDLTSLTLPPPPPLLTELTGLHGAAGGPVPSAEGVRGYSTTGTIRRSAEEGDNHPRSFIRNGNSHYYYG